MNAFCSTLARVVVASTTNNPLSPFDNLEATPQVTPVFRDAQVRVFSRQPKMKMQDSFW